MGKRLLISFLFLLVITGVLFFYFRSGSSLKNMLGGKNINEGVIEYEISYPKLDPKSMVIAGMPDKAYLRFKNNTISNDMSGMMGLISIAYISNPANKSVEQTLTLINKKYVSDISTNDLKKLNESYVESIEQGTQIKEIAGYKCKEAIVKLKDGETTHVYYTNDIDIENPNWSNPFSKIDGVLMDFQMERMEL